MGEKSAVASSQAEGDGLLPPLQLSLAGVVNSDDESKSDSFLLLFLVGVGRWQHKIISCWKKKKRQPQNNHKYSSLIHIKISKDRIEFIFTHQFMQYLSDFLAVDIKVIEITRTIALYMILRKWSSLGKCHWEENVSFFIHLCCCKHEKTHFSLFWLRCKEKRNGKSWWCSFLFPCKSRLRVFWRVVFINSPCNNYV